MLHAAVFFLCVWLVFLLHMQSFSICSAFTQSRCPLLFFLAYKQPPLVCYARTTNRRTVTDVQLATDASSQSLWVMGATYFDSHTHII
jgi:hypothetical protein